jgi:type I restriction enzyme S subunit
MARCRFGDVVKEIKNSIDRDNNPYDYYIAGGHMDSEDLHIHRRGSFKTDDVGPAFIREFQKGQVLYGSRRTYLKKVAVADFDGVTANTTFVLETKDENVLLQSLLPFVMLSDSFTEWSIGKSKGSTNPYVLFSDLADYEFELPPIEKQRTLAKLLWEIDSTKCSYKDLIDKTDEVVKSQFIEMFKDTQRVPLSEVAEIVMGQSPKGDTYNTNGEGILFNQGSGDFTDKYVATKMYCTAPTRIAKAGDVLMSVRAPVGTVNITLDDCCIGRGLAAIRSRKSKEYNEYFFQAFKVMENEIANMGQGSTVNSISKDMLLGIMMPDASIVQQGWFVKFARQSDKSKFYTVRSMS